MRVGTIITLESGEELRTTHGTTPLEDDRFIDHAQNLEKCSQRRGGCSLCYSIRECLKIHDKMSALSADHNLSQCEMERYLAKLMEFVKSDTTEPIYIFILVGAFICQFHSVVALPCGASSPLSWARSWLYS